ncbi:hypothetical protein HMI54_005251 [Coelomomyces lativittatus]|nr:hypothetical protein HMI56_001326 [Coelomomyces lativittatus]KAJ1506219.1 hypothetical protein HMI54_005251 [Coelomomyces lativittatus]
MDSLSSKVGTLDSSLAPSSQKHVGKSRTKPRVKSRSRKKRKKPTSSSPGSEVSQEFHNGSTSPINSNDSQSFLSKSPHSSDEHDRTSDHFISTPSPILLTTSDPPFSSSYPISLFTSSESMLPVPSHGTNVILPNGYESIKLSVAVVNREIVELSEDLVPNSLSTQMEHPSEATFHAFSNFPTSKNDSLTIRNEKDTLSTNEKSHKTEDYKESLVSENSIDPVDDFHVTKLKNSLTSKKSQRSPSPSGSTHSPIHAPKYENLMNSTSSLPTKPKDFLGPFVMDLLKRMSKLENKKI